MSGHFAACHAPTPLVRSANQLSGVHKADPGRGHMNGLDWSVLIGYFAVMVAIGVWSHKRVDDVSDFFTAGGKMRGGCPASRTTCRATAR